MTVELTFENPVHHVSGRARGAAGTEDIVFAEQLLANTRPLFHAGKKKFAKVSSTVILHSHVTSELTFEDSPL